MNIDFKPDLRLISTLRDAPPIAPADEDAVTPTAARAGVNPFDKSAERTGILRPRSPSARPALNAFQITGAIVGFVVYLVSVLAIGAFALCWLPFSKTDPVIR